MAVSKSNHVEKIAPSCNSADATRRTQHACVELKNRIRAHPHVRLGHGSKDMAHVLVDTSKSSRDGRGAGSVFSKIS